jgi:hypothetical protein
VEGVAEVSPGELTYLPPSSDKEPGWSAVEVRIGEAIGFAPTLTCFPRTWRSAPPAWSTGGELRTVRVESVEFERTFVARVDRAQDENWLLQLLSPSFIAWLTEAAQGDFGFELHEGTLRCFQPGRIEGPAATEMRSRVDAVVDRIRSEALESEGLGVRELHSGVPERVERAVAKVSYSSLPSDSRLASKPFRAVAARDPRVYVAALGGVVGVFTVLITFLFEVGVDAFELIVDLVSWMGPKGTGIALGVLALAGWIAAIPEAIAIASRPYGRVAFAREYARAHNLRLESPQSFHRRLMRVDLPAPAQFVLRGTLDDRREGRLVLCRSRRRILHEHYDAAVFEAGDVEARGTRGEVTYVNDDGHFVVWRSASADRSAVALDAFVSQAVELLEEIDTLDVAEGHLQEPGS